MNLAFERYIGIDYSGAETPASSLKGLRVYMADRLTTPQEVEPPPSPRKYWTRMGIAEWLVGSLSDGSPTLVGIDHGFSFPLAAHLSINSLINAPAGSGRELQGRKPSIFGTRQCRGSPGFARDKFHRDPEGLFMG